MLWPKHAAGDLERLSAQLFRVVILALFVVHDRQVVHRIESVGVSRPVHATLRFQHLREQSLRVAKVNLFCICYRQIAPRTYCIWVLRTKYAALHLI